MTSTDYTYGTVTLQRRPSNEGNNSDDDDCDEVLNILQETLDHMKCEMERSIESKASDYQYQEEQYSKHIDAINKANEQLYNEFKDNLAKVTQSIFTPYLMVFGVTDYTSVDL
jgi:rRNA maturation protein Rpf1